MLVLVSDAIRYRFDPRPRASLNSFTFTFMKIFDSTAQQLPLHQNNQLPNTQHQQLTYDWWQKLQELLRPRPPRPDSDGSDQDSGAAQSSGQCGVTSLSTPPIGHFIVGGQEAQPGQFPWQVCPPPPHTPFFFFFFFFFVISCACLMRPPSLGMKPNQAH